MALSVSPDRSGMDPTAPLTPSGNLRRRLLFSRLITTGAVSAAVIAVAALVIVTLGVAIRGAPVLSLDFLIRDPPVFGGPGGGIASAIVGTVIIIGAATVIAAPFGVLIAIYLVEFAGPASRVGSSLRMLLDVMQGIPSVVVGIVILGLIVIPTHHESGIAGALALAIIMLPLIARSSQEVLRTVPGTLREAADALGVNRWRAIVTVILPTAMGGILTGTILAVARAAGETAPLIICDNGFGNATSFNLFNPVPNIPATIFAAADDPGALPRAWGAAFVLLMIILAANIGARLLLARSRRRMGL